MDGAVEMLRRVSIPEPERRAHAYPHQMSGGMRQRVMIAMALSCNPKVLIADEPTTALDVTIQAQILDLMRELRERLGTAMVLITHDLGVVAENADRVVVMYAGRKVEEADVDELFDNPGHPYTLGLLGSIPKLDAAAAKRKPAAVDTRSKAWCRRSRGCRPVARSRRVVLTRQTSAAPNIRRMEMHRPGHWIACWHAERLLGAARMTAVCWKSRSQETFPGVQRRLFARFRPGARGRRRLVPNRSAAKHWAWSARAAAASRPSAARC